MCGGVWEYGKPMGFSIFPCPGARGKRGGDFLFKPPLAALFGSPFPPSRPQAFPAVADFLFVTFSFGGDRVRRPRKKGAKPENSRTVNQWGLQGRIPVDPLKPQYIWDNYYDVPQTIYYLEENTREMTEEEKADFRADRKVFSQRYVKLIADERERLRKKARETE